MLLLSRLILLQQLQLFECITLGHIPHEAG